MSVEMNFRERHRHWCVAAFDGGHKCTNTEERELITSPEGGPWSLVRIHHRGRPASRLQRYHSPLAVPMKGTDGETNEDTAQSYRSCQKRFNSKDGLMFYDVNIKWALFCFNILLNHGLSYSLAERNTTLREALVKKTIHVPRLHIYLFYLHT